jgi:hypothetical protein
MFFVFFSQDDIFMAMALWEEIAVVRAEAVPAHANLRSAGRPSPA